MLAAKRVVGRGAVSSIQAGLRQTAAVSSIQARTFFGVKSPVEVGTSPGLTGDLTGVKSPVNISSFVTSFFVIHISILMMIDLSTYKISSINLLHLCDVEQN